MLAHVFELFTQVDSSTTRSQSGLGIGLTLVKTLVEMHGGEVAARSDGPGRGSLFQVTLPALEPAAGSPGNSVQAEGAAAGKTPSHPDYR